MRVRRLAGCAVLLAATVGLVGAISASEAAASSCAAITISQGQGFSFDVSSVFVNEGGCVRFANLTDVTVTITVSGSSFSEKEPARTPASASASYVATRSATVTATDGVRTGRGDITVDNGNSQPTTAPAPTRSSVVPPPISTGRPTSTPPTKSSAGLPGPSDVSTEMPAAVNTQHAFAQPAIPVLPAVPPAATSSAAPATASHPVVAPQVRSDDPRLTSTVLDPINGPRRGLPATVAAVLLLGLAAAYARTVLVAAPAVDSRAIGRPVQP